MGCQNKNNAPVKEDAARPMMKVSAKVRKEEKEKRAVGNKTTTT